MQEEHSDRINILMDQLLERLKFEIEHCPAPVLPPLTAAVTHLYQAKQGIVNNDQKAMMEITLLKNINNQVRDFGKGDQNNGRNPGGRQ